MLPFLIAAFLMLTVALAIVLVPLLRSPRNRGLSDEAGNIAVLRAQKAEIEGDFAGGYTSAAERDTAMTELAARAVEEVPEAAAASSDARPPSWLPWMLGALVVVGSVSLYAVRGNRDGLQNIPAPVAAAASEDLSEQQVLAMVDALAKKMGQNPGDPRGWVLLARTQASLGRFPEAVQAFDRAVALTPKDAQLLADYADASAMIQQGRFEGKPMQLIARALAIDGNNLKALALAGTGELRQGHRAASLVYWKKLQTLLARDSDDYRQVEAIIHDINSPNTLPNAPPGKPAPAMVPPLQSEAKVEGRIEGKIEGQISLAPELAGQIAPGDTLFVFARAANGPRMPLAVMRIPVPRTWPQPYLLTDAMAMTPAMKLSAFSEVVVEARISKSGNAVAQPGDLSGVSGTVQPGGSAVPITINRKVP